MFGGIEINENWRQRYNKELMQLFGDLDRLYCHLAEHVG
jgi:hypothetical protein